MENVCFYFNFHCLVYVIRWVIKLIHFDLKVIEIFEYFLTKNTWRQIWICHMEKCLILFHFHCLGLHFSHKTEKSRFLKSLKYINFFDPKKKWRQIWICSVKHCLIWFNLCCLSRILALSWEIQILNFTEIV